MLIKRTHEGAFTSPSFSTSLIYGHLVTIVMVPKATCGGPDSMPLNLPHTEGAKT